MRLDELLKIRAEYFEYSPSIQVIPSTHPPSLRNPQKVKQQMPTDGWKQGDSKEARQKAMEDLCLIHQRMRRQFGKPELTYGANYPFFPNIFDKT